ncbi:MAG: hypothetical protein ACI9XZ_002346 [Alphaproteobacteria bacterium]
MNNIVELLIQPQNFVYLAAATQAAGLLLRAQIILRLFLLAGSGFYLTYYAVAAAFPLWEAIAAEALIASANGYGLAMLLLGRSRWLIPAGQLDLFDMIGELEPGEFKTLMRYGRIRTLETGEVFTVEGQIPDRLVYVIDGVVEIQKGSAQFELPSKHFIGEISLILNTPASATTRAPEGAQIVEWPRNDLTHAMNRNHRLKLAVEAIIGKDMARKVAAGASVITGHQSTALL